MQRYYLQNVLKIPEVDVLIVQNDSFSEWDHYLNCGYYCIQVYASLKFAAVIYFEPN